MPTVKILGRIAMPTNELVKQFGRRFGTPKQQFDLVVFSMGKSAKNLFIFYGGSPLLEGLCVPILAM